MSTFEDFLRDCLDNDHTQVRLVPRYAADGTVAFYAHGQCGPEAGETFDGSVGGNQIGGPEEQEVAEAAPVEEPEAAPEPEVEPMPEVENHEFEPVADDEELVTE